MTNNGQLPMMKNMLNSALKSGFPMSDFHCYILTANKDTVSYGTRAFRKITIKKLEVILENMKLDNDVLWIDNDIVLFQNIIPELQSIAGHFVIQDDIWSPCTGFFLVRSDEVSRKIIQNAINWLNSQVFIKENVNDQHAFNEVYRKESSLRLTLLPHETYPNGKCYFELNMTASAKIVHNNYLKTTPEKVERFKKHNLWDDSSDAFDTVNKYYI